MCISSQFHTGSKVKSKYKAEPELLSPVLSGATQNDGVDKCNPGWLWCFLEVSYELPGPYERFLPIGGEMVM